MNEDKDFMSDPVFRDAFIASAMDEEEKRSGGSSGGGDGDGSGCGCLLLILLVLIILEIADIPVFTCIAVLVFLLF